MRDVDLEVAHGERRAILGPNGAGKTTLFNVICGDFPPSAGTRRALRRGRDHAARAARARKLGLARTYQQSRLFLGLTRRGQRSTSRSLGVRRRAPPARRLPRRATRDPRARARAAGAVAIDHKLGELVGDLSHGEHRQVAIAHGARRPSRRLLMLDEPASGLSRGERQLLTELLLGLDREHHADPDRARHGRRASRRRAGDDDARRPGDRRRHAGRDPRERDSSTTSTWGAAATVDASELSRRRCSRSRASNAYYGSAQVLAGRHVRDGRESVAIIGRNGMGKTTLVQRDHGPRATARGRLGHGSTARSCSARPSYKIARRGHRLRPAGPSPVPVADGRRAPEDRRARASANGERGRASASTSCFPRLAERKRNGGAQLSGGEQQMLAIGRALLGNPRLLIMDEPSEGLAPTIVESARSRRSSTLGGTRVWRSSLIEQNLGVATSLAERQLVMVGGRDRGRDDRRGAVERPRAAAPVPRRRAARALGCALVPRLDDDPALLWLCSSRSSLRSSRCGLRRIRRCAARSRVRQHAGRRLRDLRDERGRERDSSRLTEREARRLVAGRSLLPDRAGLVARRYEDRVRRAGARGTSDIYVMQRRRDRHAAAHVDESRRLAPDLVAATATQIAFARDDDIYVMSADGSGARPISDATGRGAIPPGLRTGRGSRTSVARPARRTQNSGSCGPTDRERHARDHRRRGEHSRPAWSPDGSTDRLRDERRG